MFAFKLRDRIFGWLILALLLVILLCHFVPVASAAELDDFPSLPSRDESVYPFVTIVYYSVGDTYYLFYTDVECFSYNQTSFATLEPGKFRLYQLSGSWSLLNSGSWASPVFMSGYGIVWVNYDCYTCVKDGNVYVATDDIFMANKLAPVDPGPSSAALPVFTVQPPIITWIEYNVGDTASPVTVAAVVDDGGTISYTWYRTIYAESGSPSNVVFSTGATLVPDTSGVSDSSYYCVATNTNGEFSQSAYSRAYRVKVVESGASDPPSETPTYPSAEDIGSSVGDAFQGVFDQHDINTSEQGSSLVDQLTDIIPNHSVGFLDALGGLIVSLGYTGTECVLTVPALVMPQIGDLVPQYTLLEKQTVDLESYFNMFPDFLVTLVQSLFTAGLIIFCFREFYFVISYFLTLRWRDKDE